MSRLYSIFAGAPDTELLMKYGEGTLFRQRLGILRRSAGDFFVCHPAQDLEAVFDAVAVTVEGFSERRNEVAHGAVFDISSLPKYPLAQRNGAQFAVVPPYHTAKKYEDDTPTYAYTSAELAELVTRLREALGGIHRFRQLLLERLPGLSQASP